jgi:tetratricopeptide (TPR) repeat protein
MGCVLRAIVFSLLLLASPAQAGPVDALLRDGDRHFARRPEEAAVGQAKARFLAAATAAPGQPAAHWRLAQVHYWQAHALPKDSPVRRQLAEQGRHWAEMAMKLDKASAPANFWYAMNLSLLGESLGLPRAASLVGQVRQALQQAARSDPAYWGAGPLRMLGRIEFRAPWPIGHKDEALRLLQQAVRLAPGEPYNRLYLAEVQADQGDTAGARRTLDDLLTRPPDPAFAAETREARREAQHLLKKLR